MAEIWAADELRLAMFGRRIFPGTRATILHALLAVMVGVRCSGYVAHPADKEGVIKFPARKGEPPPENSGLWQHSLQT